MPDPISAIIHLPYENLNSRLTPSLTDPILALFQRLSTWCVAFYTCSWAFVYIHEHTEHMGPYYILLPHPVLALIMDTFKILEAKIAISSQKPKTGRRKVQLSLSGDIDGIQHPLFHRKCHVFRRANPRQTQGRREEELWGIRSKAVGPLKKAYFLHQAPHGSRGLREATLRGSPAPWGPALRRDPLLTIGRPKPHPAPPAPIHFGFRQVLPKSSSQGRTG